MEKILPYSDDKMLYNETTQRYELTIQFVKEQIGNPYADDGKLEARIKRNTRKVYEFIFNRAYSGNRRIITAIIDHTEEYRNYIFSALFSQMEADAVSGYNDQDLFTPKSKDERSLQMLNQVSVSTEQILESSSGFGGINLLYAGAFNYLVYLDFMEYVR